MYLKIVSHHEVELGVSGKNGECGPCVVPYRDWLFECQAIEVRKHRIVGFDGYCKVINPILECGKEVRVINGDLVEGAMNIELLEIYITGKSRETIVAVDVVAFAMSDNGRTVDKWFCGQYPQVEPVGNQG